MKVYLASSWRNETYQEILEALRAEGHSVYDFREGGFMWSEVGVEGEALDFDAMGDVLNLPQVRSQFNRDFTALEECDALICVLPCGRSAHLELGYACGVGRPTILLWAPGEPDVMHLMCEFVVDSFGGIRDALQTIEEGGLNDHDLPF